MIKEEVQKNGEKELMAKIEQLEKQNQILQELQNLQNEAYYRMQTLSLLDRQAVAMEQMAENSLIPIPSQDEEDKK